MVGSLCCPGSWGEQAEELLGSGERSGHGVIWVLEELSKLQAGSKVPS